MVPYSSPLFVRPFVRFSLSPCTRALTQLLLDENRRITMSATIDAVCSRVMKERQKKLDKGMSQADVAKELGSEEAHKKKACMKEVCRQAGRQAGTSGDRCRVRLSNQAKEVAVTINSLLPNKR